MRLRPCTVCRRHVDVIEVVCPFCAAELAPVDVRDAVVSGRLTRAAVFAAGASLAAGCWTAPDPQAPPPPPYEDPNGPPGGGGDVATDPNDQRFAQPPDDRRQQQQPVAGKGRIEGVVTNVQTNQPAVGISIHLRSRHVTKATVTDGQGRYSFDDLPPDTYVIQWASGHPRQGPATQSVTVKNTTQQANLSYSPYVPSNLPTPYGAPPARTRIV